MLRVGPFPFPSFSPLAYYRICINNDSLSFLSLRKDRDPHSLESPSPVLNPKNRNKCHAVKDQSTSTGVVLILIKLNIVNRWRICKVWALGIGYVWSRVLKDGEGDLAGTPRTQTHFKSSLFLSSSLKVTWWGPSPLTSASQWLWLGSKRTRTLGSEQGPTTMKKRETKPPHAL